MSMTVISIGKKHESWITEGLERYQKRLRKPFDTEWILIPHSAKEGAAGAQEESERIKTRIKDGSFVVLLDERGSSLTSPQLSDMIDKVVTAGGDTTFIIGGAYGVSDDLRQTAHFIWSLSPLVFPHQLVRLILIEQLYRAQSINRGEPYHHA